MFDVVGGESGGVYLGAKIETSWNAYAQGALYAEGVHTEDERDRLVRAWISSHGRSVHLEIGGIEVFVAPTDIHENRWYHLCQSWENQAGRYALWVNGQLWVQGRSEETVGHVIPSKGDIVLAQEYTDFDKGLEEGIEGTVLGFNLVLASAFDPLSHDSKNTLPPVSSHPITPMFTKISPKPVPRSIIFGERILPLQPHRPGRSTQALNSRFQSKIIVPWHEDELQEVPALKHEPLGLQLVKLSYVRCEIGRGSPFIGGKLMLISWTRTPVRVFGGATVKNANSKCGDF
ncbi:uncharacterized protein LOC143176937 isoform X2 [Nomia melanderi]|uniref:uncharacterized protein LOC143176937 isoform X2 n=1 Tax=Nomia melanderi TaxID=2448451 RepID=UPI003FCC6AA2